MPITGRYYTNSDWQPLLFFSDCLFNSSSFDLSLGYFSSSAIRVLSCGFASFIYNGGIMRMTINNILMPKDKAAIQAAHSRGFLDDVIDIDNLVCLKESLSDNSKHFFNCLSWLIANERINIVITKPKYGNGISHTKAGVFYDKSDNRIAFDGSCNFTQTALIDNIESINTFCSWHKDMAPRIDAYQEDFENTFNKKDDNFEYISSIDDIKDAIITSFPTKDLEELINDEQKLLSTNSFGGNYTTKYKIQEVFENAERVLNEQLIEYKKKQQEPRFPYSEPREYQKRAYNLWIKNRERGLFAMATGTGKTITSLNCLLNIYKQFKYYKAIILVPTISLVEQWERECEKFNFNNIIKIYSNNKSWKNQLSDIILQEKYISNNATPSSYIIITTYKSYNNSDVFHELNSLSNKRTLIIADEAHNMGSPAIKKKLKSIKQKRRIGLSATPDRQFDESGNQAISDFFGTENGYTFEYSMKEAIENNVLCRYFYYPHLIELNEMEMEEYIEISVKIAKFYNSNTDQLAGSTVLTSLLLKRKRIIHKAKNKADAFFKIIKESYKKNKELKYTLIYSPEGKDTSEYINNLSEEDDLLNVSDEKNNIIDSCIELTKGLDPNITIAKYVANTKNKEYLLNSFIEGKIGVLASMKCLDEGVDIPRAELAIFCSSTGNPRQFIQRRGRILRTHPQKKYAYIHDLVVIPKVDSFSESYALEKSLLKNELKRVSSFALLAENPSYTIESLYDIMNYYNLNIYNNL